MKIKVGDKVQFIAGKERHAKDNTGTVVKIVKGSNKIIVEGKNTRTKHVKKTATEAGRKVTFDAPVNASNVQVVCPQCSKPTRVGYKKLENNKKQRVCKKCNESLEQQTTKTKVKA